MDQRQTRLISAFDQLREQPRTTRRPDPGYPPPSPADQPPTLWWEVLSNGSGSAPPTAGTILDDG